MPDLLDVRLPDGRTVRAHDSGLGDAAARVTVGAIGTLTIAACCVAAARDARG